MPGFEILALVDLSSVQSYQNKSNAQVAIGQETVFIMEIMVPLKL